MPRSPRIEYPDAVYHVTSRGDRKEPIFVDDDDRKRFIEVLSEAMRRCEARLAAYCLMGNHYHLVLQTPLANLSRTMQLINGGYTHAFNKRHRKTGHLFEARFTDVHVDHHAQLLSACRYVDLNAVRAAIVQRAVDWPWSSYRAHVGEIDPPPWLDSGWLHEQLLGRPARGWDDLRQARLLYADWVEAGLSVRLWDQGLRDGKFLGDRDFVVRVRQRSGS